MPNQQRLADILRTVLQIDKDFTADTPLLGAIPEFDSMAIIAVITELEDQLGIEFDDDEISAEIFETFGQLSAFVSEKQASTMIPPLLKETTTAKFLSHSIEGKFRYGADSDAIATMRKSNWIKILNDWKGVQDAIWESAIYPPFRTAGEGFRDMSHPDNACAHIISGYILGVRPVKTGFHAFEAIPHPSGLQWAEGRVPTPHGFIDFKWKLHDQDELIYSSHISIPQGTSCKLGIPLSYFNGPYTILLNEQVIYGQEKIYPSFSESVSKNENYIYIDGLSYGDYDIKVIK